MAKYFGSLASTLEADPDNDEDDVVAAHVHARAIAGAHAAFQGGHIDQKTRDGIIKSARGALSARKQAADGDDESSDKNFYTKAGMQTLRNPKRMKVNSIAGPLGYAKMGDEDL